MLAIDSRSLCDVCLEGYSPHKLPGSIACGHVFCKDCIESLRNPSCPLCRVPFSADSIRIVHVDYNSQESTLRSIPAPSLPKESAQRKQQEDGRALLNDQDASRLRAEVRVLEDKVAKLASKKSSAEEVLTLHKELQDWLTANHSDVQPVSLSLSAVLLRAILMNHIAHSETIKQAKHVESNLRLRLADGDTFFNDLKKQVHEEERRRRGEKAKHDDREGPGLAENDDNARGRSTRVKSISPPPRPSRLSSRGTAPSTPTGQYPTRDISSGQTPGLSSATRSTFSSLSGNSSGRPNATGVSSSSYSGRSNSTDRPAFDQQGTGHRIWRPTSRPSSPPRSSPFSPSDNTASSGATGLHRSSSSSGQSATADGEAKRHMPFSGYKSTPVETQTPAPRSSSTSQNEAAPGRKNVRNAHDWERMQQETAQKQQAQFRAETAEREKAAIAKDVLAMNKVEVLAAWSNYQKWWSTARDQDILRFQAISWPTVTTVTVAEDLTVNRIASFVLSPHHSQDKSPKDRIKEQLLRWHSDRFDGRYLPKVPAEERDAVRQAVGHVVKALNELISRDRDSPFA